MGRMRWTIFCADISAPWHLARTFVIKLEPNKLRLWPEKSKREHKIIVGCLFDAFDRHICKLLYDAIEQRQFHKIP